jgi:hypothetical protein
MRRATDEADPREDMPVRVEAIMDPSHHFVSQQRNGKKNQWLGEEVEKTPGQESLQKPSKKSVQGGTGGKGKGNGQVVISRGGVLSWRRSPS